MNYIEITKQDMELQKKLLKSFQRTLETLPKGRLVTKRVKGRLYYYCADEKTRKEKYIPKSNLTLIHQLKEKRWLKKSIRIMEKNIKAQEQVLKAYQLYDSQTILNMLPDSYREEFLEEYENKVRPNLHKWAEESYRKNPYHQDELIHTTYFGLRVHSKGELIIAELLYRLGIPFRYDAAIKVRDRFGNTKWRYVDFLIKLPTGEYLLWEHMGLFAKEDYRNDQFEKLTEYYFQGYFMPNNLIITMDGPNGEFDSAAVERIIKGQILPHFK